MRKILVFSFLQVLLILSIGCKTSYTPVQNRFDQVKVQTGGDTLAPLITERFLQPYRQQLLDSFSTVIATTTADLVKKRPGGSLGNLVTESIYEYCIGQYFHARRPLFILMNYGGIRLKEIPKGAITIGKIFELLPFENTIVKVEISGSQLVKLLEQINESGGWPIYWNPKHIRTLDQLRRIEQVTLVTNNYLAAGGDNCSILKTLPQEDTGILLRDIVRDYLREQKTITPDDSEYILK